MIHIVWNRQSHSSQQELGQSAASQLGFGNPLQGEKRVGLSVSGNRMHEDLILILGHRAQADYKHSSSGSQCGPLFSFHYLLWIFLLLFFFFCSSSAGLLVFLPFRFLEFSNTQKILFYCNIDTSLLMILCSNL